MRPYDWTEVNYQLNELSKSWRTENNDLWNQKRKVKMLRLEQAWVQSRKLIQCHIVDVVVYV